MPDYISVEVENEEEIIFALYRIEARVRTKLRGVVGGIANIGLYSLRLNIPVASGSSLRRTDASGPTWRPGGAGGGGMWEAVFGVKRGGINQILYAHSGTGIYGSSRRVIRPRMDRGAATTLMTGRLRMRATSEETGKLWHGRRGVLTFQKRGEQRKFRRFVEGQRPQHFMYATFQQTRLYASARVISLGPEILRAT